MNTTTKHEILKNFEHKEFVQIDFPKITVNEVFGLSRREMEKEIPDDTVIYMRSEIQNIDHFNTIYKDGNKYYLEDNTDVCARLLKRIFGKDYVYDVFDLDNADYCLSIANYDMKEAKKLFIKKYV